MVAHEPHSPPSLPWNPCNTQPGANTSGSWADTCDSDDEEMVSNEAEKEGTMDLDAPTSDPPTRKNNAVRAGV
jgi:hypothetical protein